MRCTWKDCNKKATHEQNRDDDWNWANLCLKHHNELEAAIENPNMRIMLRAWVLASGGAKKVTE